MDYVTVATVITLVFSGAALCYWPMSLKIRAIKEELKLALQARRVFEEEAKNQVSSAQKVIEKKPGEVANKEDLIDKQLSGKYLITVLKHCITKSDRTLFYTSKAEVVKDAIGAAP